jgi:endonuclease YncB( thermonuclease family)
VSTDPAGGWVLDRYGRRLARIEIDDRDLGQVLIAEGLAAGRAGGD